VPAHLVIARLTKQHIGRRYPSAMDSDDYLNAIERECATLTIALRNGPTRDVPSCPGWRVADLAVHLGVIHRWTTEMVRSKASRPLREREKLFGVDPDNPALVKWFEQGARELVEVLRSTPADTPVWSWTPEQSVRFWTRRQAHEAAVHRWDAQNALGAPATTAVDSTLAADGIDEWLNVFAVSRSRQSSTRVGLGESYHLHCTDEQGEWVIRFEGSDIDVKREHVKADVAIRGGASDLLLFLWHRKSAETLEVLGDASLLERWSELLPAI
jgi:uncharacterized protein (TIGR03083 family)